MVENNIPEEIAAAPAADISLQNPPKPQNTFLRGCACLGKAMMSLLLVALGLLFFSSFMESYIASDYGTEGYSKSRTAILAIQMAISSYKLEYKKLPLPDPYPQKDVSVRSKGAWIAALMGKDEILNPKSIKFLEIPAAENGKNGTYQDKGAWVVTDLWGAEFYVVMDVDLDTVIANPQARPDDIGDRIPQEIKYPVIIYSSGTDGNPNTWADNIGNWW